ncbi:DUF262 domain-containing protein [Lysobacter enzymogenes]|uniref:DUF262 domain-containing protein n=1 Tax=Lysobacter enzymogenes TaxID=69 RepID=UPI00099B829A|nr:DUF262 domain-containing protein [Lysobacter enzymogenes]UZW58913.1 DUF262 domain-containing HNH endonuclease family protein [Lysobacter enzymogenes]
MKITPNALSLNQLFSSMNEQFVIPAYQRRYSWRERQIDELIEDIYLTENVDTHLLGSIVCLTGQHTAGVNQLELVDGQQRLTTITILLECIRQRVQQEDDADLVAELSRMLTAKALGKEPMRKVQLDSLDAEEFERLLKAAGAAEDEGFRNRQLVNAFKFVRGWLATLTADEVAGFLYKLQNQALIIRLDVGEAKDAFKLFETINNRGLKLSPTDIIKNFVLGNAARFGAAELQEARGSWAKLVSHLDGADSDAFFRYFLIVQLKQRVTKSEVVGEFKWLFMNEVFEAEKLPDRHLYSDDEDEDSDEGGAAANADGKSEIIEREHAASISFSDFLLRLVGCAKAYGEIVRTHTGDKRIDRHLRNLKMIKAAQTHGLLMHLRVGGIDAKRFVEVLKLTESFVLRRHVCKERANETEALFAKLCSIDPKDPLGDIREAYRDACPADDRFRDDFAAATYTSNIIDRARYCLERIEMDRHGQHEEMHVLGADAVEVEHIIPQKISSKSAKKEFGDWVEYLGERAEAKHPKYVSRIGNLTIFAGVLNITASNNPFIKKRAAYKASSIKLTQELGAMSSFKFSHVEARSAELAKIAVKLWPVP